MTKPRKNNGSQRATLAATENCPFSLCRDGESRLVLADAADRRYVGVQPVRCFPISSPDRCLAICDAAGHEVVFIDGLAALPEEMRRMIEEEIARQEFVPTIQRIVKASDAPESCQWEVETDRGYTMFHTSGDSAVRRLDQQLALIVDTNGIRYLVPNIASLDRASRRILDRFL